MISLTALTADPHGAIVFEQDAAGTRLSEPAARVSRSKTLDGGVHIEHSGVSDGDRTFTLVVPRVTEDQYTILKWLHRNYTSIHISCREGFFAGAIERIRISGGNAVLTILIEKKLA